MENLVSVYTRSFEHHADSKQLYDEIIREAASDPDAVKRKMKIFACNLAWQRYMDKQA